MVNEEIQKDEIGEGLKKFNESLKKYYYIYLVILIIIAAFFVVYMVVNAQQFKKNACQLCEDSGRHCYEPNQSMYDVTLPNMVRIEQIS